MFTSVMRIVAGSVLVAGCLASGSAAASLIYSGRTIFDPLTEFDWQLFDSVEKGALQGYRVASDSQLSELFLHYAPHDNGGELPGYEKPEYGGVELTTREDGRMFNVRWRASSYGNYSHPPSLLALGASFGFGDGYMVPNTKVLLAKVDSSDGYLDVLLRSSNSADQYGSVEGREEGYIAPELSVIQGDHWWEEFYCQIWDCSWDGLNPYLTETGDFRSSGFIMVSVPEPSTYLLMLPGLLVISSLGNRRFTRTQFLSDFMAPAKG
jgi:hypothetical protein